MSNGELTPTSYIVLGLLARTGPATPYGLKRAAAATVGNFWSVPHTQIYTEPARLAESGYLTEEREEGGRRRKVYALTRLGRRALEDWLSEPTTEFTDLRDPGLLQLFFGADRGPLAEAQLDVHRSKLASYEELERRMTGDVPAGARLSLRAGIGHEREWVRFWERIAREPG
jgi:PadR family transcriptional regulator, regulatory protein AphA